MFIGRIACQNVLIAGLLAVYAPIRMKRKIYQ